MYVLTTYSYTDFDYKLSDSKRINYIGFETLGSQYTFMPNMLKQIVKYDTYEKAIQNLRFYSLIYPTGIFNIVPYDLAKEICNYQSFLIKLDYT